MLSILRRAGRKVARRIGVGIVALTFVSIVLLSSVVWLFLSLNERQSNVRQSVREDAVWAAFQTDREASRLVEAAIHALDGGVVDDISLRFDLLYSRVSLLDTGSYAITFGASSEVGPLAADVTRQIADLTPVIDALVAQPQTLPIVAPQILSAAHDIRTATGTLLVVANAAVSELRMAERSQALSTYWLIGAGVAGLTSALILIVGLLGIQLHLISRDGRKISLLSRKNARIAVRANAASQAKSAFLATLSHEIRTPLNGIIGVADLMKGSNLTAEQSRQVDMIRQSGDMLLDVITDVLDYSKLEAGAVRFEPMAVELGQVFGVLEDMMRPRAQAAGLDLVISYPAWTITADANRIRQVVVNLISNAIKFTETGSVSVAATLSGQTLRVEVSDTGPGIAQKDVQLLFREFSQLDSSNSRSFGGTGLGLAICKRLVEVMNGEIGVSTALGKGSTFWFEVPVAPAMLTVERAARQVAVPALYPLAGHVLVVDDNQINRDVAAGVLKRLGLAVTTAGNGQEAVDLLASGSFDLVLMDMQMPRLDGLAATRILRANGCRVPIIGLTANAFDSDRQACLEAGMNGYLAKPATTDKLLDVLARYLPHTETVHPAVPGLTVDRSYQSVLREELGAADFDLLLEQFASSTRDMLASAERAIALGDGAELDAILHTLKGAAQTMGYPSIAEAAQALRAVDPGQADLGPLQAQCHQLSQAA